MGRNGCNLFKFAWLGLLYAFILGSVSTCWRALEAIEAIWCLGLNDYRLTFRAHQQFQIIAKTNTGKQLEDGHNLLIYNIRKESIGKQIRMLACIMLLDSYCCLVYRTFCLTNRRSTMIWSVLSPLAFGKLHELASWHLCIYLTLIFCLRFSTSCQTDRRSWWNL